jgi:hypothetical protein
LIWGWIQGIILLRLSIVSCLCCQPPQRSSYILSDCSLALYPPESTRVPSQILAASHPLGLCITIEFHHHLCRQPQECSCHILYDCSLALCPPKLTPWSLTNRCLLPSSIHTIFSVRLQIVIFWIHGIFHRNTILFENRLHI